MSTIELLALLMTLLGHLALLAGVLWLVFVAINKLHEQSVRNDPAASFLVARRKQAAVERIKARNSRMIRYQHNNVRDFFLKLVFLGGLDAYNRSHGFLGTVGTATFSIPFSLVELVSISNERRFHAPKMIDPDNVETAKLVLNWIDPTLYPHKRLSHVIIDDLDGVSIKSRFGLFKKVAKAIKKKANKKKSQKKVEEGKAEHADSTLVVCTAITEPQTPTSPWKKIKAKAQKKAQFFKRLFKGKTEAK